MSEGPFTRHDLDTLADLVGEAWTAAGGGDWSAPAGTLEWTCARTADHAVDAVLAVGFFLASRRRDGYPEWEWSVPTTAQAGRPELAGEAIATVGHVVSAVVAAAPPDIRAVIWRRPRVEVRGPEDFPARAGLELILHGHDVCTGLGVPLRPPRPEIARLVEHSRGWPHWSSPGWRPVPELGPGEDPWAALLAASGRVSSG
jgi:hypothetical protein